MNIVVLAGGISTEREVSIVSGTGVCQALRKKGHRAILVDVFCGDARVASERIEDCFPKEYDVASAADYMRSMSEEIEEIKKSGREFFGPNVLELCKLADIVFLALHGADGEGGKVQAAFDLLGIRYTGTDFVSGALAMDKCLAKELFLQNGIPTPAGFRLKKGQEPGEGRQPKFPCVVKVSSGGSSIGVSIVQKE